MTTSAVRYVCRSTQHTARYRKSRPRPNRDSYSSGTRSCWSNTNRAPRFLNRRPSRKNRSGGLHACTTSTGPIRRARRQVCHNAVPYSLANPSGPPTAARNGYRWMCTPSISAYGSVSRFVPCGQMTCTSQPASRSARLSCHTRRSNGTERFSTRISALPAKAHVPIGCPARFRVGEADEVDDDPVARGGERLQHGRFLAADDADLGVREDVGDGVAEQVAQVRQPALDVFPVRAHQPGQRHVGVVDAQVVSLAQQALGEFHERALPQVVGARLERQPEQPDPPPA